MTLGIVEDMLACRKNGHNFGLGAGIKTPFPQEGQYQQCSVCKCKRECKNGSLVYWAPPALMDYPRGMVKS